MCGIAGIYKEINNDTSHRNPSSGYSIGKVSRTYISENTAGKILRYKMCNPDKVMIIPNVVDNSLIHIVHDFNLVCILNYMRVWNKVIVH